MNQFTKAWCEKMAKLEDGHEVGAGALDHPLRMPMSSKIECWDSAGHAAMWDVLHVIGDYAIVALPTHSATVARRSQGAWKLMPLHDLVSRLVAAEAESS